MTARGTEPPKAVQLAAAPSASSSSSQLLVDTAAMEAAGDAAGCLRALETAPATAGVLAQRGRCLMRAGRCSEGRRLLALSTPSSLGPRATAGLVAVIAADRCPVDQLTDEERMYRASQRVGAASAAEDPAACSQTGREFWALYRRSPPSTSWDNQSVASVLEAAARCLGRAGRCDDGRAMFRLRSEAFFGGTPSPASNEQSDSQFDQVSHCPSRSTPATSPADGGSP